MKFLLGIFDKLRPHFEDAGKFRILGPVFDATDAFFFSPDTATNCSPHVRDPMDIKRYMSLVILALIPATVAGFYFYGLRVLPMIFVSYAAGGTVEMIFAIVRKESINEGFLVTGLLFPLILPPTLPLWMVAVGISFGVLVSKELFGGTGRNIFNPAILARCFLALSYPLEMTSKWLTPGKVFPGRLLEYASMDTVDAVTQATPLIEAKQGIYAPVSDLLWGTTSGCIGETSAILIIIGGLFLVMTRVANWRVVVSTLLSFFLFGLLMNLLEVKSFAPVGWHLVSGGLLFGAFFMATDPVSSPSTNPARWMYGGLIGVSTLLIRNLTGYVEGMMFAILLGNVFAPTLDEIIFRLRKKKYVSINTQTPEAGVE